MLPFAISTPYTTTASLVPIEMFFGRYRQRKTVVDRFGTKLVYGGRQLGKSALLRDVERRYHNPAVGVVVRWIDLKNLGIGINRPIADLWTEIGRVLHEQKVFDTPVTATNTVIARVKEWLDGDPGRRILLVLDDPRYRLIALRSANVMNLLGSKDRIETALLDVSTQPAPPVYEGGTFRRAIGEDPWIRSPLTAAEEATLSALENQTVVLFGSKLSGLDGLVEGLKGIVNLSSVHVSPPMTQTYQFDRWLRGVDDAYKQGQDGVALAVVLSTNPWSSGASCAARECLRGAELRPEGKSLPPDGRGIR